MKNIFLFLSLTLLLASCKSFDKEISAINNLTSKWDAVANMASAFSNSLNEANADFTQKIAGVEIDSSAFATLPTEQQDKILMAKENLMSVGNELTGLTDDFGLLLDEWNAKSDMVDKLKENVSAKTFDPGTLTEVEDLTSFVDNTNNQLGQFNERLETLKEGVTTNHADLSGLMASLVK
ncbi:MAG: hypothetical protein KDC53_02495 [Saprospiraceae bacterium]|nr:hypothetical protein [Saprospiraceae bacterium]